MQWNRNIYIAIVHYIGKGMENISIDKSKSSKVKLVDSVDCFSIYETTETPEMRVILYQRGSATRHLIARLNFSIIQTHWLLLLFSHCHLNKKDVHSSILFLSTWEVSRVLVPPKSPVNFSLAFRMFLFSSAFLFFFFLMPAHRLRIYPRPKNSLVKITSWWSGENPRGWIWVRTRPLDSRYRRTISNVRRRPYKDFNTCKDITLEASFFHQFFRTISIDLEFGYVKIL